MAKQVRHTKGTNMQAPHGRGTTFEHQESYDDSLLPDAIELGKLQELDPNIIEWIKERTAKEQDARLDFNNRKMIIIEQSSLRAFIIDIISLTFAFIIILGGMYFSYILVSSGLTTIGTIFAGATIVLAATAFLEFRKKLNPEKNKSSQ